MSRVISDAMTAVTIILLITFLSHRARAETGTWKLSTGEVVSVTCPPPALQEDETMTLRLPEGCRVLHPRIGYTLVQDLNLRSELSTLRAQVELLTREVSESRARADEMAAQSAETLRGTREKLQACGTERNDLEVKLDLEQARVAELEQVMVERVALGASLGVVAGAGGLVLALLLTR